MAKKSRDITNSNRSINDSITDISDHGGADDAISIVSIVCRICFDDNKEEPIITPCLCKGSVAFVHTSCLEKWLAESNTSTCELCHHVYETEKIPRYSAKQSVWQWLRHQRQSPNIGPGAPAQAAQLRTRQIRCDLIACAILTPLAIIVTYICLFSADYYNQQRYASAPTARWTSLSLLVLIAIMLFGYYLWVYVVVGYHGRMWYYWWQREWVVRYIQPSAAAVAAAQAHSRASGTGGTGGNTTTTTVATAQVQSRPVVPTQPVPMPGTGVGIRVPLSDVDRVPGVNRNTNMAAIHHQSPTSPIGGHHQQQLSPVHEEIIAISQEAVIIDLTNQLSDDDDVGEQLKINNDDVDDDDEEQPATYCGEYYQPDDQPQLDPNNRSMIVDSFSRECYNADSKAAAADSLK